MIKTRRAKYRIVSWDLVGVERRWERGEAIRISTFVSTCLRIDPARLYWQFSLSIYVSYALYWWYVDVDNSNHLTPCTYVDPNYATMPQIWVWGLRIIQLAVCSSDLDASGTCRLYLKCKEYICCTYWNRLCRLYSGKGWNSNLL